jgi:hypothetical protein
LTVTPPAEWTTAAVVKHGAQCVVKSGYVRRLRHAQDALASLPSELRARMSNLEIVVEDEPPPGQRVPESLRY